MSKDNINIMFVIERLDIGGAERQLVEVLKGLDRNAFTPFLVCLRKGTGFMSEVASLNIPVLYALRRWRWDPFVIWKIRRFIRSYNVSLVHTYMPLSSIYGSIAAKLSGVPIVNSSIRGSRVPTLYERMLLKPSFKLSNTVLSNSRAGKHVYDELAGHSIKVVYNGVDLERFRSVNGKEEKLKELNIQKFKQVVTFVGRLEPVKNPLMFVRVAKIVLEVRPDTAFLIVGDGSMKKDLEQAIAGAGLDLRVFLLGARKDVEQILGITDVGVLTSNSEGLPNALIEMLASGVPVVATNCEGTGEVVDHGRTGFCVEKDDVEEMSRDIIGLLSDDKLRGAMGKEGRSVVSERFDLNKMVRTLEGIYKELILSNVKYVN